MKRTLVKQTRDTQYSVGDTNMPNTQLSLIIVKQLQYEHYRLGLQLGQSHTTHLTSPRHSYTDSSHQDSSIATTFTTPAEHPKHASTTDSPSLLCHKTSHRPVVLSHSMPHPDLRQDFPKLNPKEGHPNSVHRITSRNTSPPMWSDLAP
jgi:hypothetical protein